jgi:hypothetical protein
MVPLVDRKDINSKVLLPKYVPFKPACEKGVASYRITKSLRFVYRRGSDTVFQHPIKAIAQSKSIHSKQCWFSKMWHSIYS